MKLIDRDKLKKHLDYLIQKEEQLAKECALSPNNEFERQRRYCFEANALAYALCENVMDYYIVADTQVMNQWISVKDKLPEEAVKVLIYTEYNATAYGFFTGAYYNNRPLFAITMNRNSKHSWYEEIRVSHWMPLPEPPKDGDK